eukprot:m.164896 g.164896  ORF g.164896 m.164896 type:complete len:366 (-) comp9889_c0_seq2:259-1356(-)
MAAHPQLARVFVLALVFAHVLLCVRAQDNETETEDECASEEPPEYDRGFHIGAIFIILVTSLTGAVIPLVARHAGTGISPIALACAKLFGAGVILATGLIHMWPEADQSLTNPCLSTTFTEDYTAFAGLFALAAILCVMQLQIAASIYLQSRHKHKHAPTASKSELVAVTTLDGKAADGAHPHHDGHGHGDADTGHVHALIFDARVEKHVGTLVLELGIASHSVIIGVTLGVTPDNEFRPLLAALVFHQFFEGLALASVVIESEFKRVWVPIAMILFYSITTPVGVAIGVGVHDHYNENATGTLLSTGILEAIAAGILVYDALVNVITPHIACPLFRDTTTASRAVQLACLWLGAACMAVLAHWA